MNPRYPIMAALLAASLGTVSPGTSHATPPCPEASATERNPINVLAGIVCRDSAAKDYIGVKLAEFTLSTDGAGPLFVAKDVIDDEARKTAVAGRAKEWAKTAPADKVAELYYVMGDGAPPAWVTGNAVLKDKIAAATDAVTDRRRGLKPALTAKWRAGSQGKIAWVGFADNVNLFLLDAAAAARTILSEARTRGELGLSIDRNESAPVVPVGPGRRVSDFTPFGPEYMYANGGQAGSFKDKDGNPVPYNIKLETTKDNTGNLTTNIVVYDVSQGYMQRFPITTRGETTFRIGSAQHNWSLVLDVKQGEGQDLAISLRRPEDKDGKEAIRTTANALAQARLDQAVQAGQVVDIGGQSFYMSAQGGKDGSYLYYPTSLANRTGSWTDLRPAHVAVIAKIGTDGLFVPVAGTPDIGKIDGKPYKLEYDERTKRWVPKEGQGTMPVVAPAATNVATGDVADRAVAAAAADNWTLDPATEGLSIEVKNAGYRIMSRVNPQNNQKDYNIITPPGFIAGNSRTMGGITDVRGVGHYFAWKRNDEITYQDLLVKATVVNEAGQQRDDFDIVARVKAGVLASVVNTVDGRKRTLKDFIVLEDGLKTYLEMPAADVAKTLTNARAQVGTSEYIIESARKTAVHLQVPPNATVQVFPATVTPGDRTNPQTRGEGTAVDVPSSAGGTDVPFQEKMDVTVNNTTHLKVKRVKMDLDDPAKATAALYVLETASEADARWYLYIKFKETVPAAGGRPETTAIRRSDRILVFSNVASDARLKSPDLARLGVKGQAGDNGVIDPRTVSVAMVPGSTEQRGAWTLHRAQSSQVNKTNCARAVIWWGMTEAEATTAGCTAGRVN